MELTCKHAETLQYMQETIISIRWNGNSFPASTAARPRRHPRAAGQCRDNLFVTGDTPFTFPTPFTFGTTFSANVFLPPPANLSLATFSLLPPCYRNISDVLVDCQHNDWLGCFPHLLPTSILTEPLPWRPTRLAAYLSPFFATANPNTPGGRTCNA